VSYVSDRVLPDHLSHHSKVKGVVMREWSEDEIRATVKDYFAMLASEMRGENYNKSDHRSALMDKISGRSKGAVELKHQNISAVLHEEGLRFVMGYKPRGNYQKLLRDHVLQYVHDHDLDLTQVADKEDVFSWSILSDVEAIKRVDKSAILYHGTGVPKQVLPFFGIDDANPPKSLRVIYHDKKLNLRVSVDPFHRVRIFWPKVMSEDIARAFPVETAMLKAEEEQGRGAIIMHFRKLNDLYFEIEFYGAGVLAEETVPDEYMAQVEGKAVRVEYLRRVRSAINRQKAIEIHGTACAVCGFDFHKTYGDLGRGFIEVHHLKPLGESEEETEVNPETDLIPLCANCHRMIHRGESGAIAPDKLKEMLEQDVSPKRMTNKKAVRLRHDLIIREIVMRQQTVDVLEGAIFADESDSKYLIKLIIFELLLKIVYENCLGFFAPKIHSYEKIFTLLPQDIQGKILTIAEQCNQKLNLRVSHSKVLKTLGRNFVNMRYPYEKYRGMTESKYKTKGSEWIAKGAEEKDADFIYYPNELDALTFALKQIAGID